PLRHHPPLPSFPTRRSSDLVRLKDAKGLHYLGQLLRHPGRAFEVVELKMLVADRARRTPGRRAPSVDPGGGDAAERARKAVTNRSEEHTSELQSRSDLVCRL